MLTDSYVPVVYPITCTTAIGLKAALCINPQPQMRQNSSVLQQKKFYLKIFFTDMGVWKSSLVNCMEMKKLINNISITDL